MTINRHIKSYILKLLTRKKSVDFEISLKKQINNRLFMFHAGKLEIVSKLSRKDIKTL